MAANTSESQGGIEVACPEGCSGQKWGLEGYRQIGEVPRILRTCVNCGERMVRAGGDD